MGRSEPSPSPALERGGGGILQVSIGALAPASGKDFGGESVRGRVASHELLEDMVTKSANSARRSARVPHVRCDLRNKNIIFPVVLGGFFNMGSVAKVTVKKSAGPARSTTSIGRNVALIVVVLLMLISGTLAAVKITTDYLLYQSATADARSWAGFMAKSIADLEPIAAGELPSAASMSFFQWAQKSDQVFRYEIFNREGYSQLVADHNQITLLALSEYSAAAAGSGMTGRPVVETKEGDSPDLPSFYARAYVPV